MVRYSIQTQVAILVAMVFVLGLDRPCMAQSTDPERVDTPTQRWLPAPKAYPTQQAHQAKLLSLLRDSLRQGDGNKPANSSRLSDSDVQSLKEAMKQFEQYFPKGLTPDSLDAIPPELISKALSNPELVKQARELAEKYSKENQKNKSGEKTPKGEESNAERKPNQDTIPPNAKSPKKSQASSKPNEPISEEQPNKSFPQMDPNGRGFADLMDKLRRTQQTYEQNQEDLKSESGRALPSSAKERASSGKASPQDSKEPSPTWDNPETPPASPTDSAPLSPSQPTRQGQQEPATSQKQNGTGTASATNGLSSSPLRNRDPKQPTNAKPSDSVPFNPQRLEPQRSGPNSSQPKTESASPTGSREKSSSDDTSSWDRLGNEIRKTFTDGRFGNSPGIEKASTEKQSASSSKKEGERPSTNPLSRDRVPSSDSKTGSQPGSSLDIRNELDRRGFGPTMQKIVEEAQRASQAARPKATPAKPPTQAESPPSTSPQSGKPGNQASKTDIAATAPSKQPSSRLSKPNESSPSSPKADSSFSKSIQKTGDYLSKLWKDATKNSAASPTPAADRSSATSSPTSTPLARPEIPSIPNPFNTQFLQCILILAVVAVVAFIALKVRFKNEQERKEALAAQMAPKIDEIQTRDDVVRAFHALAKQRLQSAQAWWTCGYVADRFQETLPEHAQPIRTLSGLYEQARYFPTEHRLSDDQIQSAKLALKECEG